MRGCAERVILSAVGVADGSSMRGGRRRPRVGHRTGRVVVGAALVVGFLLALLTLHGTVLTVVDDLVLVLVAISTGALCAWRARRAGDARRAWRLLGLACLSWGFGVILFSWRELVTHDEPFPSLADVGFLGLYPLAVLGLLAFPVVPGRRAARARLVLDGLLLSSALLFVTWTLVLAPVVAASGISSVAKALAIAYPCLDAVLIGIVLIVLARAAGDRRPLGLLGAGLVAIAVADSSFLVISLTSRYHSGQLLDVSFFLGFVLIALAALEPAAPRPALAPTRRTLSLLVPYLPVALVMAITIARELAGRGLTGLPLWNLLILVVALLGRQMFALLDNRALTNELAATVDGLRHREQELRHRAFHDPLTGLANRQALFEQLRRVLLRAGGRHGGEDGQQHVALLFVDLDGFKPVNDALGHAVGDELLVAVGERLRTCVRPHDLVARLGGDEFVVLLDEATDAAAARQVADRVLGALAAPFPIADRNVQITASIGIAVASGARCREVGADGLADMLVRDADLAMYAAKERGGGRWAFLPHPAMGLGANRTAG